MYCNSMVWIEVKTMNITLKERLHNDKVIVKTGITQIGILLSFEIEQRIGEVRYLRKKWCKWGRIITVWGVGYKFNGKL